MQAPARQMGKQHDQIDSLTGQLKEEYNAAKSYRKRAMRAESEHEELRETLSQEREKCEALRAELLESNGRVQQLEKELDEIRKRLTILTTSLKTIFERRKSNLEERRLSRRRNSQQQRQSETSCPDQPDRPVSSPSLMRGGGCDTGGRVQKLREQVRRLEKDFSAKFRKAVVLPSPVAVCPDELPEHLQQRVNQKSHDSDDRETAARKNPTLPTPHQRIQRDHEDGPLKLSCSGTHQHETADSSAEPSPWYATLFFRLCEEKVKQGSLARSETMTKRTNQKMSYKGRTAPAA